MQKYNISHKAIPQQMLDDILCLPFKEGEGHNVLQKLSDHYILKLLQAEVYGLTHKLMDPVLAHTISVPTYDKNSRDCILWELHDDKNEAEWITLLFLDYDTSKWVGGELDIYFNHNLFNFPNNKIRIQPEKGTIVTFDASLLHKICPYFGSVPRKTLSVGWS